MQETQVQSPDWDNTLEKKMATHSSTLVFSPGKSIIQRGAQQATVQRVTKELAILNSHGCHFIVLYCIDPTFVKCLDLPPGPWLQIPFFTIY